MQTQKEQPFLLKSVASESSFSSANIFDQEALNSKNYQSTNDKESECVQKEQTIEQTHDRYNNLHNRLQQEADKIRRWKTQTEMEIKQKDGKLVNSTKTIDSLRKSLLDMQFENEKLSSKLNEEIENHKDVAQRIQSNRELCNFVREFASNIDERLKVCETDRTEIKYLEREHLQNVDDLSSKFKQLELFSENRLKDLKEKFLAYKEDHNSMQLRLQKNLDDSKHENKRLIEEYNSLNDKKAECEEDLNDTSKRLAESLQSIENLNAKLVSMENDFCDQSATLTNALNDNASLRTEKKMLESQLDTIKDQLAHINIEKRNMEVEFESYKQSNENTLLSLREEINTINEKMDQKHLKLQSLQQQNDKMSAQIVETTSIQDILIVEKSELTSEISLLKDEISELNEKLICSTNQIEEQSEAHEEDIQKVQSLEKQLNTNKINESGLLNQIGCLEDENRISKTTIGNLTAEIQVIKTSLFDTQTLYDTAQEDLAKFKTQLQEIECEKSKLETKCNILVNNVKSLENEREYLDNNATMYQKQLSEYIEKNEILQEQIDNIKSDNSQLREKIKHSEGKLRSHEEKSGTLLEEINLKAENMKEELQLSSRNHKDLEKQIQTMKTTLTSKNKKIEELQKEVKVHKLDVERRNKSIESFRCKLEETENKIKILDTKYSDQSRELSDCMRELETVKQNAEYQNKLADEMKLKADEAVKEMNAKSEKHEQEMHNMIDTLENYQRENYRIVEQQDKQISNLEQENTRISKLQYQQEMSADSLKAGYEKTIKKLNEEKHIKDKELSTLKAEIKSLKTKLNDYEEKKNKFNNQKITPVRDTKAMATGTTPCQNRPKIAEVMATPQNKLLRIPQTPQRSLINASKAEIAKILMTPMKPSLKNKLDANGKRRKVMFQSDSDNDTSSSEGMDIEISKEANTIQQKIQNNIKDTPNVRIAKTPKFNAAILKTDSNKFSVTLPKPVPRGQSANKTTKGQKPQSDSVTNSNLRVAPSKVVKESVLLKQSKESLVRHTKHSDTFNWLDNVEMSVAED